MSQQQHRKPSSMSFVHIAHEMLGDPSLSSAISWDEAGTSFEIKAVAAFSAVILPRFFRHCNFSSFLRQLNLYGFKKEPGRHCYSHPEFFRGGREMLRKMKRSLVKTAPPQLTEMPIYRDLQGIAAKLAAIQCSEVQLRSGGCTPLARVREASVLKEMNIHLDEAIRLLASYPDQHWRTEQMNMRPELLENERSTH